MKTVVYYGLERMTIKTLRQKIKGMDKEIIATKSMARAAAALSDDGRAEVSSVCETNKGPAVTIRVTI